MARTSRSAHALTEHNEIRRWAEERGAQPACVRGTGGSDDVGMIRLDFPGYSEADSLEPISWDDWFRKFDENNLALLVQDATARGQRSNFNKLVSRDTAGERKENRSRRSQSRKTRSTARAGRGRASRRKSKSTTGSHRRASSRSRSVSARSWAGRARSSARARSSRSSSSRSRGRSSSTRAGGSRRTLRMTGKRATTRTRESSRRRAA